MNGVSGSSSNRDSAEEARQRLEEENFDLKLRLFYIQQSQPSSSSSSGLVNQSALPRDDLVLLQLEERGIELEQKNLLIVKAKRVSPLAYSARFKVLYCFGDYPLYRRPLRV